MQASFRWNDGGGGTHFLAGPLFRLLPCFQVRHCPATLFVIYGQEVLYAARGQDARSRPAKAEIQWFR